MLRSGLLNSLSQTLIKLTAPGVPDIYQGTELFEFSMADPDNRRQVNYDHRRKILSQMKREVETQVAEAYAEESHPNRWAMGESKLYVMWKVLTLRKQFPALFEKGFLPTSGYQRLYMRNAVWHSPACTTSQACITVVPRLSAEIVGYDSRTFYRLGRHQVRTSGVIEGGSDSQTYLPGSSTYLLFTRGFTQR